MPFTRTNWMNYSPPAINAANLLNMEDGIWYGLAHSGGVRNTAEFLDRNPASVTGGLAEAIADLGGSPGVVFAAPHNHPIDVNRTIPAEIYLIADRGAIFTIANGITFTVSGTFEGDLSQHFILVGTGVVVFGAGSVNGVYPHWWYSGAGLWTTAFANTLAAMPPGSTFFIPPQSYDGQIVATSKNNFIIRGFGMDSHLNSSVGDVLVLDACDRVTLVDFRVGGIGEGSESAGHGVEITNTSQDITLRGVLAYYCTNDGFRLREAWIIDFHGCRARKNLDHGFSALREVGDGWVPSQIRYFGCQATMNGDHGFYFDDLTGGGSGPNPVLYGCTASDNLGSGVHGLYCSGIKIDGGSFEDNGVDGVDLTTVTTGRIQGYFDGNAVEGIDLHGCDRMTIADNRPSGAQTIKLDAISDHNILFNNPGFTITDLGGGNQYLDEIEISQTGNIGTGDGNLYGGTMPLDDDEAKPFTPGNTRGLIQIFGRHADFDQWWGIFSYRVSGAAFTNALTAAANFDNTTGVLAGNTGVDGHVTISADAASGQIYLENRSGIAIDLSYTLLGS